MSNTAVLSLENVSKRFGEHRALRSINLNIEQGEFVGLLGPNGAGKSTLVKILDGVYESSGGEIRLNGEVVSSLSGLPTVGFVHQDLGLIEDFSLVDNLRLGEAKIRGNGVFLNGKGEIDAARSALAIVGLELPVMTLVRSLSPAEKALVAIARVFARGATLLFVDEITSTLSPSEARRVTQQLALMASKGATVVMVSHKLSEVLDVTKRIVLLIDGRIAVDRPTEGLDRESLTALLMEHGRVAAQSVSDLDDSAVSAPTAREAVRTDKVRLEARGVRFGHIGPIDLELYGGEVLGIGGLAGSGLHDLAFLLHRSSRPDVGSVVLAEGSRTALVPPHRETQGGFDDLTVEENITVSALRRWGRLFGLLALEAQRADAQLEADSLNVQPASLAYRFGALSGGNKQKVIFGRALLCEADVLVLCEPTRGVDISTRREIYRVISRLRAAEKAIVILSSDSEDLLTICDKISIIYDGTLSPFRRVGEIAESDLEALL